MSDLVGEIDIILHENKQLREQNRVLRANLVNCVARLEAYYGEDYPAVRDAKAALTATMPAGGEQDEKWMVNRQRRQYAFTPEGTLLREEPK